MKISELKNAPQWLINADTHNADVDIIDGRVHWHDGAWHDGLWCGGLWRNGVWRNGAWHDGTWRGGEWCDGEWRDGLWRGGVWRGGEWRGGVWCGGLWRDGLWHGGEWRGGEWFGGEWRDGVLYKHSPYYTCAIGDIIKIGCQEKTRAEWDEIFSNAQELDDIERGTELARATYAEYKAMCAYKDAWDSDVWK